LPALMACLSCAGGLPRYDPSAVGNRRPALANGVGCPAQPCTGGRTPAVCWRLCVDRRTVTTAVASGRCASHRHRGVFAVGHRHRVGSRRGTARQRGARAVHGAARHSSSLRYARSAAVPRARCGAGGPAEATDRPHGAEPGLDRARHGVSTACSTVGSGCVGMAAAARTCAMCAWRLCCHAGPSSGLRPARAGRACAAMVPVKRLLPGLFPMSLLLRWSSTRSSCCVRWIATVLYHRVFAPLVRHLLRAPRRRRGRRPRQRMRGCRSPGTPRRWCTLAWPLRCSTPHGPTGARPNSSRAR
jgi:hypothetical protein